MRIPDFFIVGGPKCGTTALYHYLKDHPSIFMPNTKEVSYFCKDLPNFPYRVRNWDAYLQLFSQAPPGLLWGEKSSLYLYSEVAVGEIFSKNANAKFIAILRNPIHAVRSLHAQQLYSFQEDVSDLPTAWHLQSERRSGRQLPAHCQEPKCLLYREVYSYPAQIRRLFANVPAQNCLVLIFEECFQDVRAAYNQVLAFLGLPPSDRTVFPRVNESKVHPFPTLAAFLRHPPFPLNYVRPQLKRIVNTCGWQPVRAFERRANRNRPSSLPVQPEFERELATIFSDEIVELEQVLGRDLSIWKRHHKTVADPISAAHNGGGRTIERRSG